MPNLFGTWKCSTSIVLAILLGKLSEDCLPAFRWYFGAKNIVWFFQFSFRPIFFSEFKNLASIIVLYAFFFMRSNTSLNFISDETIVSTFSRMQFAHVLVWFEFVGKAWEDGRIWNMLRSKVFQNYSKNEPDNKYTARKKIKLELVINKRKLWLK